MFRRQNFYIPFGLVSIIYIIGTLAAPLTPNRFNLSTARTHFLQITIALPVVLIWATAVYGAERFKSYTNRIKKHPDGKALEWFSSGLTILIGSVLFNALFSLMRPWAFKDGWLPTFTIMSNYIAIAGALLAFIFMYKGSVELQKLAKTKSPGHNNVVVGIILAILAVIYILVLINYPYRNSTPDPSKYSSLYLPDVLILLTIFLPFLISWGLGIQACLNILSYQKNIKGAIYKASLTRLVKGVLIVVSFIILLQLLIVFSTFFAEARLATILAVVYLIILLYGVGFLVIASGSRKLNAIEKIGK